MRIPPLSKIYFLIFLASLILTITVGFVLFRYITPFQLKVNGYNRPPHNSDRYVTFRDLNHDGFDERIVLVRENQAARYYAKVYQDGKIGLLDQFNLVHPLILKYPIFGDVNLDGWEDILVFSNNDSTLFLNIIDAKNRQFLIKEHPILPASPDRSQPHWDIITVQGYYTDLNLDGTKELVIAVNTGYAHLPRCVILYDIQRDSILSRFDHHMGYVELRMLDINRDGYPELALQNVSTRNLPDSVFLSDQYTWMVILDHQLTPLFRPRRIGGAFSNCSIYPVTTLPTPYFLYACWDDSTSLRLVNSKGKIMYSYSIPQAFNRVLMDTTGFLVSTTHAYIYKLNKHLQFLWKKHYKEYSYLSLSSPFYYRNFLFYPALTPKTILILNNHFQIVSRYSVDKPASLLTMAPIRTYNSPTPKCAAIGFDQTLILEFLSNPWYPFLWPIIGFIWIASLLAFSALHWFVNRIRQYTSYFIYSIRHSNHAIILLDHQGKVLTFNRRINNFLALNPPLQYGQKASQGLRARPAVLQAITECTNTHQQINRQFKFETPQKTFVGEITVTPFYSFFNFVNAYLVEIKDSTQEVLHERQVNWQRNIRRIVHDIKTPLAGVQLKLQTLYLKLREHYPDAAAQIENELNAAHSEVARIRNITRDFLKFSDLDRLSPEELELIPFIHQCIQPFYAYTHDSLHITVQFKTGLPNTVRWDARQIELLLHVLLENSLDALKGRGEIQILLERDAHQPEQVIIRIIDNGSGIPEDIKEHIFEPHFTTKKEGSGLGLTFAKHIVQQHGGSIEFSSVHSSGTIFVIILPINPTTQREKTDEAHFGRG